jgi:hypothetical protein
LSPRRSDVAVAVTALRLAAAALEYRFLSCSDFSNDHFVHLAVADEPRPRVIPVRARSAIASSRVSIRS